MNEETQSRTSKASPVRLKTRSMSRESERCQSSNATESDRHRHGLRSAGVSPSMIQRQLSLCFSEISKAKGPYRGPNIGINPRGGFGVTPEVCLIQRRRDITHPGQLTPSRRSEEHLRVSKARMRTENPLLFCDHLRNSKQRKTSAILSEDYASDLTII